MAVYVPAGMLSCPRLLSPQQVIDPAALIAQEWYQPATTSLNDPAGGVLCFLPLAPQQARVPLFRITQWWPAPAAMRLKSDPAGGENPPSPQHLIAPSEIPHV